MQEVESPYPVDESFDPLSEDYLEDPYPHYARFRREAPVFFAPKIDVWVVSRYEDVLGIVKDTETFPNARVQEPYGSWSWRRCLKEGMRVTPTTSKADPPKHRGTRRVC